VIRADIPPAQGEDSASFKSSGGSRHREGPSLRDPGAEPMKDFNHFYTFFIHSG